MNAETAALKTDFNKENAQMRKWKLNPNLYQSDLPPGKTFDMMTKADWTKYKRSIFNIFADGKPGEKYEDRPHPWGTNHPSGRRLSDIILGVTEDGELNGDV